MLLDGAKFICLNENGEQVQTIAAKGRYFTIGCLLDCDCILERAEQIHCKIECDAFGHVTIYNKSQKQPISVNGETVTIKRTLFNNSKIKILDKEYIWKHAKTSTNVDVITEGSTEGMSTPSKQIGIPVQQPNSCPTLKYHRNLTNRFTVHNLRSYRVDSDESNYIDENDETVECKATAVQTETVTESTNSNQTLLDHTPSKVDLVDSTSDKKTSSTEKRLKTFRSIWGWSGMISTSYSPREAGVRVEKTFTAIIAPKTPNSSLCRTPKGLLARLGVEKPDQTNAELIAFSTPSKKDSNNTSSHGIVVEHKKSAMKIFDLTTPSKLRPESPYPKTLTAKKSSAVKSLASFSEKSIKSNTTNVVPVTITPKIVTETSTSISTSSVITVDSSATATDISENLVSNITTPKRIQTTVATTTGSVLRKQALLASVQKQQKAEVAAGTTPIRTLPSSSESIATNTPISSKFQSSAIIAEKKPVTEKAASTSNVSTTTTKQKSTMRKLDISTNEKAESSLSKPVKLLQDFNNSNKDVSISADKKTSVVKCTNNAQIMLTTSTPYKPAAIDKPNSTQLEDTTKFFSALHSSNEENEEELPLGNETTNAVKKIIEGDELMKEIQEILNTSDEIKKQLQETGTNEISNFGPRNVSPIPTSIELIEPIIPPTDLKTTPKGNTTSLVLLKAITTAEKQLMRTSKEDEEKENNFNKTLTTTTTTPMPSARRRISVTGTTTTSSVSEAVNSSVVSTPLTPKRVTSKGCPSMNENSVGNLTHNHTIDHLNTENMGAIVEQVADHEVSASTVNKPEADQVDNEFTPHKTVDASAALIASVEINTEACSNKETLQKLNEVDLTETDDEVVMSPLQCLDESFAEPCNSESKVKAQDKSAPSKQSTNSELECEKKVIAEENIKDRKESNRTTLSKTVDIQFLNDDKKETTMQLDESFGEVEYLEDSELSQEIEEEFQKEVALNKTLEINASKDTIESIEKQLPLNEVSIIEVLSEGEGEQIDEPDEHQKKNKTLDETSRTGNIEKSIAEMPIDNSSGEQQETNCEPVSISEEAEKLNKSSAMSEIVDLTLNESLEPDSNNTSKSVKVNLLLEKTTNKLDEGESIVDTSNINEMFLEKSIITETSKLQLNETQKTSTTNKDQSSFDVTILENSKQSEESILQEEVEPNKNDDQTLSEVTIEKEHAEIVENQENTIEPLLMSAINKSSATSEIVDLTINVSIEPDTKDTNKASEEHVLLEKTSSKLDKIEQTVKSSNIDETLFQKSHITETSKETQNISKTIKDQSSFDVTLLEHSKLNEESILQEKLELNEKQETRKEVHNTEKSVSGITIDEDPTKLVVKDSVLQEKLELNETNDDNLMLANEVVERNLETPEKVQKFDEKSDQVIDKQNELDAVSSANEIAKQIVEDEVIMLDESIKPDEESILQEKLELNETQETRKEVHNSEKSLSGITIDEDLTNLVEGSILQEKLEFNETNDDNLMLAKEVVENLETPEKFQKFDEKCDQVIDKQNELEAAVSANEIAKQIVEEEVIMLDESIKLNEAVKVSNKNEDNVINDESLAAEIADDLKTELNKNTQNPTKMMPTEISNLVDDKDSLETPKTTSGTTDEVVKTHKETTKNEETEKSDNFLEAMEITQIIEDDHVKTDKVNETKLLNVSLETKLDDENTERAESSKNQTKETLNKIVHKEIAVENEEQALNNDESIVRAENSKQQQLSKEIQAHETSHKISTMENLNSEENQESSEILKLNEPLETRVEPLLLQQVESKTSAKENMQKFNEKEIQAKEIYESMEQTLPSELENTKNTTEVRTSTIVIEILNEEQLKLDETTENVNQLDVTQTNLNETKIETNTKLKAVEFVKSEEEEETLNNDTKHDKNCEKIEQSEISASKEVEQILEVSSDPKAYIEINDKVPDSKMSEAEIFEDELEAEVTSNDKQEIEVNGAEMTLEQETEPMIHKTSNDESKIAKSNDEMKVITGVLEFEQKAVAAGTILETVGEIKEKKLEVTEAEKEIESISENPIEPLDEPTTETIENDEQLKANTLEQLEDSNIETNTDHIEFKETSNSSVKVDPMAIMAGDQETVRETEGNKTGVTEVEKEVVPISGNPDESVELQLATVTETLEKYEQLKANTLEQLEDSIIETNTDHIESNETTNMASKVDSAAEMADDQKADTTETIFETSREIEEKKVEVMEAQKEIGSISGNPDEPVTEIKEKDDHLKTKTLEQLEDSKTETNTDNIEFKETSNLSAMVDSVASDQEENTVEKIFETVRETEENKTVVTKPEKEVECISENLDEAVELQLEPLTETIEKDEQLKANTLEQLEDSNIETNTDHKEFKESTNSSAKVDPMAVIAGDTKADTVETTFDTENKTELATAEKEVEPIPEKPDETVELQLEPVTETSEKDEQLKANIIYELEDSIIETNIDHIEFNETTNMASKVDSTAAMAGDQKAGTTETIFETARENEEKKLKVTKSAKEVRHTSGNQDEPVEPVTEIKEKDDHLKTKTLEQLEDSNIETNTDHIEFKETSNSSVKVDSVASDQEENTVEKIFETVRETEENKTVVTKPEKDVGCISENLDEAVELQLEPVTETIEKNEQLKANILEQLEDSIIETNTDQIESNETTNVSSKIDSTAAIAGDHHKAVTDETIIETVREIEEKKLEVTEAEKEVESISENPDEPTTETIENDEQLKANTLEQLEDSIIETNTDHIKSNETTNMASKVDSMAEMVGEQKADTTEIIFEAAREIEEKKLEVTESAKEVGHTSGNQDEPVESVTEIKEKDVHLKTNTLEQLEGSNIEMNTDHIEFKETSNSTAKDDSMAGDKKADTVETIFKTEKKTEVTMTEKEVVPISESQDNQQLQLQLEPVTEIKEKHDPIKANTFEQLEDSNIETNTENIELNETTNMSGKIEEISVTKNVLETKAVKNTSIVEKSSENDEQEKTCTVTRKSPDMFDEDEDKLSQIAENVVIEENNVELSTETLETETSCLNIKEAVPSVERKEQKELIEESKVQPKNKTIEEICVEEKVASVTVKLHEKINKKEIIEDLDSQKTDVINERAETSKLEKFVAFQKNADSDESKSFNKILANSELKQSEVEKIVAKTELEHSIEEVCSIKNIEHMQTELEQNNETQKEFSACQAETKKTKENDKLEQSTVIEHKAAIFNLILAQQKQTTVQSITTTESKESIELTLTETTLSKGVEQLAECEISAKYVGARKKDTPTKSESPVKGETTITQSCNETLVKADQTSLVKTIEIEEVLVKANQTVKIKGTKKSEATEIVNSENQKNLQINAKEDDSETTTNKAEDFMLLINEHNKQVVGNAEESLNETKKSVTPAEEHTNELPTKDTFESEAIITSEKKELAINEDTFEGDSSNLDEIKINDAKTTTSTEKKQPSIESEIEVTKKDTKKTGSRGLRQRAAVGPKYDESSDTELDAHGHSRKRRSIGGSQKNSMKKHKEVADADVADVAHNVITTECTVNKNTLELEEQSEASDTVKTTVINTTEEPIAKTPLRKKRTRKNTEESHEEPPTREEIIETAKKSNTKRRGAVKAKTTIKQEETEAVEEVETSSPFVTKKKQPTRRQLAKQALLAEFEQNITTTVDTMPATAATELKKPVDATTTTTATELETTIKSTGGRRGKAKKADNKTELVEKEQTEKAPQVLDTSKAEISFNAEKKTASTRKGRNTKATVEHEKVEIHEEIKNESETSQKNSSSNTRKPRGGRKSTEMEHTIADEVVNATVTTTKTATKRRGGKFEQVAAASEQVTEPIPMKRSRRLNSHTEKVETVTLEKQNEHEKIATATTEKTRGKRVKDTENLIEAAKEETKLETVNEETTMTSGNDAKKTTRSRGGGRGKKHVEVMESSEETKPPIVVEEITAEEFKNPTTTTAPAPRGGRGKKHVEVMESSEETKPPIVVDEITAEESKHPTTTTAPALRGGRGKKHVEVMESSEETKPPIVVEEITAEESKNPTTTTAPAPRGGRGKKHVEVMESSEETKLEEITAEGSKNPTTAPATRGGRGKKHVAVMESTEETKPPLIVEEITAEESKCSTTTTKARGGARGKKHVEVMESSEETKPPSIVEEITVEESKSPTTTTKKSRGGGRGKKHVEVMESSEETKPPLTLEEITAEDAKISTTTTTKSRARRAGRKQVEEENVEIETKLETDEEVATTSSSVIKSKANSTSSRARRGKKQQQLNESVEEVEAKSEITEIVEEKTSIPVNKQSSTPRNVRGRRGVATPAEILEKDNTSKSTKRANKRTKEIIEEIQIETQQPEDEQQQTADITIEVASNDATQSEVGKRTNRGGTTSRRVTTAKKQKLETADDNDDDDDTNDTKSSLAAKIDEIENSMTVAETSTKRKPTRSRRIQKKQTTAVTEDELNNKTAQRRKQVHFDEASNANTTTENQVAATTTQATLDVQNVVLTTAAVETEAPKRLRRRL